MVATGKSSPEQTPDYSIGQLLPQRDVSIEHMKSHRWQPTEPMVVALQYGSEMSDTYAPGALSQYPSAGFQDSPECHIRRVSEPTQSVESMNHSYGHYPGPYSSRASSTLASPSPMTPNTEDMIDQWASRRQPSDFATSAAQSSFSPKSPIDYDFPTGTHMLPLSNGSYEPITQADFFPEGYDTDQARGLFDRGSLTLDTTSSCIPMNGPPYPPQILDQNGDIFPQPYLDPHVLDMAMPDEPYTTPNELLNMDYGAEIHVPGAHDDPDDALPSLQEVDYVTTHDHDDVYGGRSPVEEVQTLPLLTATQSSEPSNYQKVTQNESSPTSLGQRPHQVRSSLKANYRCATCNKAHDSQTKLRKHVRKEHDRPYPCIFSHYGCHSVFGTKNEWSRHVKVQHLRLETWKCNVDDCERYVSDEDRLLTPSASKGKGEYDRKDLFLNHVRRCHKDQYPQQGMIEGTQAMTYEDSVQQDCHVTLRAPPMQTLCPCCPGVVWADFDLRLEHVGRTMEHNEEARVGFQDPHLEMYLLREGLLRWREPGEWLLTGAEGKKGGKQARRGSHKKSTSNPQAVLPAADEEQQEAWIQPSRKSKRVELKKKRQQRQLKQRPVQPPENEDDSNEDADADADDDDDYPGTT